MNSLEQTSCEYWRGVLADGFTKSAREKIEAAGGTAQVIEIPSEPLAALGVEPPADNG